MQLPAEASEVAEKGVQAAVTAGAAQPAGEPAASSSTADTRWPFIPCTAGTALKTLLWSYPGLQDTVNMDTIA